MVKNTTTLTLILVKCVGGPRETGLPNCELLIGDGKVKYGTIGELGTANIVTIKEQNMHGNQ